ncbi:MAG: hypothetical protein J6D52_04405 [Clostridia bacterium]|nr:hypothetical protein [Clostridia bacterium]
MTETIIRGYRVKHDIDTNKAKLLVEQYLDMGVLCADGTHAILTLDKTLRIRFKYEGSKREYIEIKMLQKKTKDT